MPFFFVSLITLLSIVLSIVLYRIDRLGTGVKSGVIFTPITLVLLHEYAFSWPPSFFDYYFNPEANVILFLALFCALMGLVAGLVSCQKLFPGAQLLVTRFQAKRLVENYPFSRTQSMGVLGFFLMIIGLLLYQGVPPAIENLKNVLTVGYEDNAHESMAEARLSLTKGHHFGQKYRGQGVLRWISRVGWTFMSGVAIVRCTSGNKFFRLLIAAICLGGNFIFVAGDGTRGPFLWSLVTIMVIVSLHFQVKKKQLIGFVFLLFAILIGISVTQKLSGVITGGGGINEIIVKLIERTFLGNGANTNDVIRFIDSGIMEKQWGSIHYNDLAAAVPFVHSDQPFTYELFQIQNPYANSSRTTLASLTYLGRLYAEGGLFSVFFGYTIIGALSCIIQLFMKTQKTPESVAFNGMLIMSCGQLPLIGTVQFLMSVLVLLFIYFMFSFLLAVFSYERVHNSLFYRNSIVPVSRKPRPQV